jgi:hypothetical protein
MQDSQHNSSSNSNYTTTRKPLNNDDLLNLKISLETSQDVLEFVEDVHIFSDH